ncbi:MAG TPA: hypothetical protein H9795_02970 [Candidatus Fournierella merdigallinarum]|nr:hypothetical protein [Candidatus Fournierella merdigallinarum]
MLERIEGNEELKQSLKAALGAGRLSNSVLLCGETGCGVGFAARCLAADYLFAAGGPAAEAVLEGRSPECLEVRGQGARGEILVGQARQARASVYETALSAAGRVVIFYGAHRMNPSAANALLKVLEEPPAGVLFLLTAPGAAGVLATIRSRCGQYTVAPVSAGACEAYLKKNFPGCRDAALLAAVSAGRIGWAARIAADEAARRTLDTALEAARAAAGADRYGLLRLLSAFEKDRAAAGRLLEDLAAIGAAALEGADLGLGRPDAGRIAAAAARARRDLDRNLNQKLLLTRLAGELAG